MSAASLGESNAADLAASYDRGFSLLKSATERESQRDYVGAQKMYVDGCEVFMQLKDKETDPKKKETIRKNLAEFISAAERVSKKLEAIKPGTQTAGGETGDTGEGGETRMEIIRPGPTGKEAEGEPNKGNVYNDAEMGEGMLGEDPVLEIAARNNSKSKFVGIIFLILLLIAGIILIVVLTGSNNSSTNEGSFTIEEGWRIEVEAEIGGFDEDKTLIQVEDQVRPTIQVVEDELDLDSEEEQLLFEIEELSEGLYKIIYSIRSEINGSLEIQKEFIQNNVDSIEQSILEAIFGPSPTDEQTISIDDTDEGLLIVELTASPTFQPTPAPTEDPTFQPTRAPTDDPTFQPTPAPTTAMPTTTWEPTLVPTLPPSSYPTQGPTVVGPVTQTINWVASLCCLLESEIDSTVGSIAFVLTLDTDRIDVASYNGARRRSDQESRSSWNINYHIYIYTTDDPNLYNEIIAKLADDDVLNSIANHITSNTDATISTLDTVSVSIMDNDRGLGLGTILLYVLYASGGAILLAVCCFLVCKCKSCKTC